MTGRIAPLSVGLGMLLAFGLDVGEPAARGSLGSMNDALAGRLQDEGAASFVKSWNDLINVVAAKGCTMREVS